jgi:hypothetical protein
MFLVEKRQLNPEVKAYIRCVKEGITAEYYWNSILI